MTRTEPTLTKTIRAIWPSACSEAIEWASQYNDDEGHTAWRECERGDWMLGLAARAGVDRKAIVRACVDVAAVEVWRHDNTDERPLAALEAALAWCEGEAAIEEVRSAAAAAAAADAAAAAAYAAAAAAADAAAYAAYAAAAAAYAAAAAADAARGTSLRVSAEIVRRHIPWAKVRDAMAAKVSA